MLAWAESARHRPDSKAQQLIDWLHRTLKPGGRWNDERVILFTEYRATQNWLCGLLAREGFAEKGPDGEKRLLTLYGGMDTRERIREDLGNVGPVIAQQVEEAMLGRRRRLDTSRAEANAPSRSPTCRPYSRASCATRSASAPTSRSSTCLNWEEAGPCVAADLNTRTRT